MLSVNSSSGERRSVRWMTKITAEYTISRRKICDKLENVRTEPPTSKTEFRISQATNGCQTNKFIQRLLCSC